jgi:phosphoribosylaminoimidazole-succinocarboxamide synthase
MKRVVRETHLEGLAVRRGKVRDVYDLGDQILIVATDRISAYDVVMPTGIPDKGRLLTQISLWWFEFLADVTASHVVTADVRRMPKAVRDQAEVLEGRSMLCRKADVFPVECVVRGYLAGSGWREYQEHGTVCGLRLAQGLRQCDRLPEPLFTPATKAESGHDENISLERAGRIIGREVAEELKRRSIAVYAKAAAYARERGILIADTKFEWGRADGKIILVDEALTPDSSRFWPADGYEPGHDQPSFDKQFLRNWLDTLDWDKKPPGPQLPEEIVTKTRAKYVEAYERLTGTRFG